MSDKDKDFKSSLPAVLSFAFSNRDSRTNSGRSQLQSIGEETVKNCKLVSKQFC